MDRVRAVRFGVKSLQYLESYIGKSKQEIADDPKSAAVIGIRGAKVKFSSMEKIETEETDWKDRRPTDEFWMNLVDIVDTLSGRPKASRTLPGSPAFAGVPGVPMDHTPLPSAHGSPVMEGSKTPQLPNTGTGRRESLQLPPAMPNGTMR
jgi:hypothetical protein